MEGGKIIIVGVIIGGMIGFDMGGRVKKVGLLLGCGLIGEGK